MQQHSSFIIQWYCPISNTAGGSPDTAQEMMVRELPLLKAENNTLEFQVPKVLRTLSYSTIIPWF
jgi:hypothetical protein